MDLTFVADLISLTNVALLIYLIMTKRFYILLGVFVLMLLNHFIKKIISEPRPDGAKNCDLVNTGGPAKTFGMPSGHVAIITTILVLLDCSPTIILPLIALMSWSRVYRGCHTIPQTIVGAVLGAVFGIIWKKGYNT